MIKRVKDILQGKAPLKARRSSKWSKFRKKFIKKNPVCAVCGAKKKLEVHHIVPFHISPELELKEENLITLCESRTHNCHFIFGHLINYRYFNKRICLLAKDFTELRNLAKLRTLTKKLRNKQRRK